MNNENETPAKQIEITISLRTYLLALTVVVFAYVIYLIAPLFLLLFISLLFGITLTSLERILMRRGWKKWVADSILIFGVVSILVFVFFYLIPVAVSQMQRAMEQIPDLKKQLSHMASPMIREGAGKVFNNSPDTLNQLWTQIHMIANHTLTGFLEFGVMVIVAFYILLDGPKTYLWLLAFFKPATRRRLDATAREIGPIVESYVLGQVITSTLAAIWVFTTAYFLGIPAALTLGVLAAVFDILPGLGFTINTILSVAMGLTVSTDAAIIMGLSMVTYSIIENYLVVPYIYGKKLKLSPLVVLLSVIVGGTVAGIPGMIAVLPIVAAYGPIERRWLKRYEELENAVHLHERLEGKTSADIIDARND